MPTTHDVYEQKFNLHLAYLGNGNYAELVLQTVTVQYEIFSIPDPYEVEEVDTKPQVIGTLTSNENDTLEKLMGLGLRTTQTEKPSASAGSQKDLPRLKAKLSHSGSSKPCNTVSTMDIAPPKVEPLLSICHAAARRPPYL